MTLTMTKWSESNLMFQIIFILSHGAFVVQLVGFATPLWVYFTGKERIKDLEFLPADVHSLGLWEMCGDDGCIEAKMNCFPGW